MARVGERTAQKERTRQSLLAAARSLVEEGVQPTMGRVAVRAGVSEATLYRHYSQPRALLRDALTVEWPDLDAVIADVRAAEDLSDRVERAAIAMATFVLSQEGSVRTLLSSTRQEPRASTHRSGLPEASFRRRLVTAVLDGLELPEADLRSLELALIVIVSPQAVLTIADAMPTQPNEIARELAWMACRQVAGHLGRN